MRNDNNMPLHITYGTVLCKLTLCLKSILGSIFALFRTVPMKKSIADEFHSTIFISPLLLISSFLATSLFFSLTYDRYLKLLNTRINYSFLHLSEITRVCAYIYKTDIHFWWDQFSNVLQFIDLHHCEVIFQCL